MRSERKQGFPADTYPATAYVGSSKNLKDRKDLGCPRGVEGRYSAMWGARALSLSPFLSLALSHSLWWRRARPGAGSGVSLRRQGEVLSDVEGGGLSPSPLSSRSLARSRSLSLDLVETCKAWSGAVGVRGARTGSFVEEAKAESVRKR